VRVGVAPGPDSQPPAIAPLFEQPGILTPPGKIVLEPSFQYSYSSNNRVALVGYTVIPALLIGLIDVREVKRNTLTAALTGRFGLTNRFEVVANCLPGPLLIECSLPAADRLATSNYLRATS
jgi:hypothetical protein